jgi:hypothetical protein
MPTNGGPLHRKSASNRRSLDRQVDETVGFVDLTVQLSSYELINFELTVHRCHDQRVRGRDLGPQGRFDSSPLEGCRPGRVIPAERLRPIGLRKTAHPNCWLGALVGRCEQQITMAGRADRTPARQVLAAQQSSSVGFDARQYFSLVKVYGLLIRVHVPTHLAGLADRTVRISPASCAVDLDRIRWHAPPLTARELNPLRHQDHHPCKVHQCPGARALRQVAAFSATVCSPSRPATGHKAALRSANRGLGVEA